MMKTAKQINDAQTGRIKLEKFAESILRSAHCDRCGQDIDAGLCIRCQGKWLLRPDSEGWWWRATHCKNGWGIEKCIYIFNLNLYKRTVPAIRWQKAIVPELPQEKP